MRIVSSGKGLHSAGFYKKKKREKRIKLILWILVGLLFLTLLSFISRDERILIIEVVVEEENVVDKEEIAQTVRDMLAGRYFWVIPRTNAFIYPRWSIKQDLLEKFPRLKSVDLDLDGFRTLSVLVEEREPYALYCAGAFSFTNNPDCYLADEDGFVFAPAPSFSGAAYFIYATENPIEKPLGKKFIESGELKRLIVFMESLFALNIYPVALEIRDLEYSLFLPAGGRITWRKDADTVIIRSNLEAFLSEDSITKQENFLNRVSEINLTIENKIYWTLDD